MGPQALQGIRALMKFPRKTLVASLVAVSALVAVPASASAYVFWSNSGGTPSIGRANDDGSSVNQDFLTGLTGTPAFMDLQGDWVYWGTSTANGPIGRVKVSGASPAASFMTFTANVRAGVDVTANRIYWSDNSKKLQWGDPTCPDPPASSSCKRSNVATFSSGATWPNDTVFQSGYAYWSQGASIYRVAVNEATAVASLVNTANPGAWKSPSGATAIEGVASDGTYLYYVDRTNAKIGRIAIADGTVNTDFVTNLTNGISSPSTASPYGLDVDSSYIYWTDSANNTIGRAPITGSSSPSGNFITGANAPRGVTVGGPFSSLSPSAQSFGSQPVAGGATPDQTFTLSSSGASNLTIDSAGITLGGANADQFQITGGTCAAGSSSLASGQSCTVTVSFDPSSEGSKSATLSVATNDGTKTATLSGTGTVPTGSISPSSGSFGSQAVSGGPSAPSTFTLSSTGGANLTIDSAGITLGGANADQFQITGGTCAAGSSSLASGQSCTVTVSFDPSSEGSKSATLSVATNDGTKTASLTGNGWDGRYLFWTSDDGGTGFSLGRSLSTGDSPDDDFAGGLVGEAGLMAGAENFVYWGTEMPYQSGNTRIGRALITGSDTLPSWEVFGTSAQDRAAVAVYGHKLYWLNRASRSIGIKDLPDGGHNGAFITGLQSNPRGIAADESGIYWSVGGDIWRADLNGGNKALWKSTGATGIEGLAVDSNYVYFAARADGYIGHVDKSSLAAGSFVTNLGTGVAGAVTSTPYGVVVDGTYVYWADRANGTIGRAPLAGSSAPDGAFVSGLNQPTGVALGVAAPTAAVDPAGINFGEQDIIAGATTSRVITVSSTGLNALSLSTPTISGADQADFSIRSTDCSGATLSPSSTCQIEVAFDPNSPGERSATLSVASNATLSPETVGLAGIGIDPAPPAATITSHPLRAATANSATFKFRSDMPGSTFECRLDGRAWSDCTSPKTYKSIPYGQHIFRVRAIASSRTGAIASYAWAIRRKRG